MEFSELICTGRAQAELLRGPETPPLRGTLCVTGHHLLLSPGPEATPDLWLLLLRSVDSIEKRVAGGSGTITLRCKDLRVLQLDIEGVEATLDIARSIEALSSLESVITSFPFFCRPKGLRLGDAWHFHPPESYYKRVAREVLLRCSQPLTGPQKRRCAEDEELLRAVLEGARPGARGYIVDTRSAQAAKQARITGGGTEAKAAYPGWKWLHRPLEREGACVLVHGAEGTDSTLLVTSLAQLILDPMNRTMAGFQELVEREWIQAGHPFQLHCAHSALSHACPKHEAPTFLLFLDCVWQLGHQFPLSLEFGEGLLLALFDHAYASLFGTFLCNSEKESLDPSCQNILPTALIKTPVLSYLDH